jgi:hypothetical protein
MNGKYQRDAVLKDLHENVIEVTFTKVNGEQRVLRCTLDPKYLPPNYDAQHLDEQHKKKENLSVIAAWDLNNNGWRSFRIESIQYLQVIDAG